MSLNPLRKDLSRAGRVSSVAETPFQVEVDASLAGFQSVRQDLERRVKRGDMTPKTAREHAAEAATRLRTILARRAEEYSPVPRSFLDRVVATCEARKAAKDRSSLESLQRETNRLLKESLIEQQVAARAPEFEGRAFVRPMVGGQPAPTVQSLVQFHEMAMMAGDEPAMEWTRRQLEAIRPRVFTPEDERAIDAATDRPDRLNPRIAARYVEAMREADSATMENFVSESIAARDTNALTAAFVLAREAPEGGAARWVRAVLDGLDAFPDAALHTLRAWEVESRAAEVEEARNHAEFAALKAESEARLAGLESPSAAEIDGLTRFESLPVAAPGESFGLVPTRRGASEEEWQSVEIAERI